jgi:hypothetical protein
MMDIESHTIIYLREMLSTAVAEDASITAFLSCWAYEEFFHSQVLKRLLESQGAAIDDRRFAALRRAKPADYVAQKFARLLSRMTRHFPAVHMTWGAINELSTLTGYRALIDRTRHRCSPPCSRASSRTSAAIFRSTSTRRACACGPAPRGF